MYVKLIKVDKMIRLRDMIMIEKKRIKIKLDANGSAMKIYIQS